MSAPLLSRLRSRTLLWRMAGNSAWLFGEQALRVLAGALVGIIVARHLGPSAFGTLNIAYACATLVGAVAVLGLGGVVVRDLVRQPEAAPAILGSALALRIAATAIAGGVGVAVVALLDEPSRELTWLVVVAMSALPFQVVDVIDAAFQSQLRGRAIAMGRGIAFLVSSGARLLFVVIGAPLLLFASAPVIESMVAAAILTAAYFASPNAARGWRVDRARLAPMLKAAGPIGLSGFLVIAIMQSDKLMLGGLVGPDPVGAYAAAVMLSMAWYMVPVIIGGSAAPALTSLHDSDHAIYLKRLREVLAVVSGLGVIVALGGVLLAKPIVLLLFGAPFSDAAPVLMVHIWTGVFVGHVSIRTRALLIEGSSGVVMLLSAGTLAGNLALNWLLIPPHGAMGAALATLGAWASAALLLPLLFASTRRFPAFMLQSLNPIGWFRVLAR